jgi:pimeloyl-ACP methyl ester carboxylesterase
MKPEELATTLAANGRASIPYIDPFSPERPLMLECYRPETHTPDKPVVIVQHGMNRNGHDYCNAWIPAADARGLPVVAITFPEASWPGPDLYNNGNVREKDGTVRPRESWSQAIPGRAFALLRASGITTCDKAYLWGHSAGGQFVHRLMATQPHDIFESVGAANAGWYSVPTLDLPYPQGLGGIGLTRDDLAKLLAYPMTIFAGDLDTETASDNLPKHEAAMALGPHRLARAHTYLARGPAEAARLGVVCNWRLIVAPGIGHQGMRMSAFAAFHWFGVEAP